MTMRISDALQSLVAAYNDWGDFLGNPRYIRKNFEISWVNRVSNFRQTLIKESHVLQMAEEGQYSFQIVEDGSLLQLYYEFNNDGTQIQSASLSFYRAWSESSMRNDDTILSEVGVAPIDSRSTKDHFTAWLRIDYDPDAKEQGIIHHHCHMHISNFPDTRFIVSGIPSPRQFIEFVISSCYPEKYKKHCLKLEVNENSEVNFWKYADDNRIKSVNLHCSPFPSNPIYNQLSHFHIPSE